MSTAPKPAAALNEKLSWHDGRLIERCLKGDEDAWDVLIDRYKNLIFSIPVKYGFSREDAADVFQSVCLDFLKELPRLRDAKALPKWLIQIAAHTCLRRRREQEPLRTASSDEIETLPDADRELPEEWLHEIDREQALRTAVNDLPARCQELVRMLFYEMPSRPYAEIAAQLGLAQGSIGFIRGRCLAKLRRKLEKAGF